jgi:hypothetical protein
MLLYYSSNNRSSSFKAGRHIECAILSLFVVFILIDKFYVVFFPGDRCHCPDHLPRKVDVVICVLTVCLEKGDADHLLDHLLDQLSDHLSDHQ